MTPCQLIIFARFRELLNRLDFIDKQHYKRHLALAFIDCHMPPTRTPAPPPQTDTYTSGDARRQIWIIGINND
jgi:hypothetical protein